AVFGSNASSHATISIGWAAPPAGSLTPPAPLMASAAAWAPTGTSVKCTLGPVRDVMTPSLIGVPVGLAPVVAVVPDDPDDPDFFELLPHAAATSASTSTTAAAPSLRFEANIAVSPLWTRATRLCPPAVETYSQSAKEAITLY